MENMFAIIITKDHIKDSIEFQIILLLKKLETFIKNQFYQVCTIIIFAVVLKC